MPIIGYSSTKGYFPRSKRAPAWMTRASVASVAIFDPLPEASITQETLHLFSTALSAGRTMQTPVSVPAISSVRRPVVSI